MTTLARDEAAEDDPSDLQIPHISSLREERGNQGKSTVILSKTIIGAGIAALPLTNAMLGFPLALMFLLLLAGATFVSLNILVRAIISTKCPSYPEVTRHRLGRPWALLLEIAIVAFGVGLMIVYEVVIGDMLVGKEGYKGLLCGSFGGVFCSRPLVVGVVSAIVLLPAISFRSLESSAAASWIGMGALFVWGVGTLILLIAALAKSKVHDVRWTPDKERLGGSGIRLFANICAVIPVLTTSYSCQAAAPFVMAEVRPKSERAMQAVSLGAVAITTALYALISLGSYLVFGTGVQSDVLHNYTPAALASVVPHWLAQTLYVVVRLSFLLGVMTLFPLMMFPARDGLVRLLARRTEPLPPLAFYLVTYGIAGAVYLVSVVTPSIWGPIQIIGATAGAVIGFIIPGLLAFREQELVEEAEEREPLLSDPSQPRQWDFSNAAGWVLISLGIVQSIAGIASQALGPS